jgi:hypothetical protein
MIDRTDRIDELLINIEDRSYAQLLEEKKEIAKLFIENQATKVREKYDETANATKELLQRTTDIIQ